MSAPRLAGVNLGLVAGLAQHLVESTDFATFLRRVLRAAGRRVGCGDLNGLSHLAALSADADHALETAVTGLRAVGTSWEGIAERLGVAERAAQHRWATGRDTDTEIAGGGW